MIKKCSALFVVLSVVVLLFSGCAGDEPKENKVVCVAFPEYDFACRICGNATDVVMLLPAGSEAHDFEPTAKDIKIIASSIVFFYNGGESDAWIERVLKSAGEINAVSLINCCTSPIFVDGEDGIEQDEHIWTSPKNAIIMAEKIYYSLLDIMPEKRDELETNYLRLLGDLSTLDSELTALGSRLDGKTVIIGDRNPFAYLSRDYGIKTAAAFHGCGHDGEPSAAELKNLITVAREENALSVFYVDFSSGKIARTVAEELGNVSVKHLNSCHNIGAEDLKTKGYYELMMENIAVLSEVYDVAD